jgi:hypothetical protein
MVTIKINIGGKISSPIIHTSETSKKSEYANLTLSTISTNWVSCISAITIAKRILQILSLPSIA